MDAHIGEMAALGTAVLWTVTALAFEAAAKRIGSLSLNILRLVVALILFSIIGIAFRGELLPLSAGGSVWFWLSLSGLVGFVFGDLFLFQAYIDIGARLTQVVFASAPIMSAIMGYLLLGEKLSLFSLLGMIIVVIGIGVVILDGQGGGTAGPMRRGSGRKLRGILCGLGGALGQAGGLVLSKIGAPDYDPFAATQIRVVAGIVGFFVVALVWGRFAEPWKALKDGTSMKFLSVGAFFGPFLGVTLGLFAVQRASAGVTATLMGLTPILILAPSALISKERITVREAIGAGAAVFGSALLFL